MKKHKSVTMSLSQTNCMSTIGGVVGLLSGMTLCAQSSVWACPPSHFFNTTVALGSAGLFALVNLNEKKLPQDSLWLLNLLLSMVPSFAFTAKDLYTCKVARPSLLEVLPTFLLPAAVYIISSNHVVHDYLCPPAFKQGRTRMKAEDKDLIERAKKSAADYLARKSRQQGGSIHSKTRSGYNMNAHEFENAQARAFNSHSAPAGGQLMMKTIVIPGKESSLNNASSRMPLPSELYHTIPGIRSSLCVQLSRMCSLFRATDD